MIVSDEQWKVKSPTIVLLLISLSIFLVYCRSLCWVHIYLYCYIFFLDWSLDHYVMSLSFITVFILKSVLSDMSIATPVFFWFPFAWNIFFHPLTFSLYVLLDLNWISCRQPIFRFCFSVHSASLVFWLEHLIHLHLR